MTASRFLHSPVQTRADDVLAGDTQQVIVAHVGSLVHVHLVVGQSAPTTAMVALDARFEEGEDVVPVGFGVVKCDVLHLGAPVPCVPGHEAKAGPTQPEGPGDVLLSLEQAEEPVLVPVSAPRRHDVLLAYDTAHGLAGQGEADLKVRDLDVLRDDREDLGGQLQQSTFFGGLVRGLVGEHRGWDEEWLVRTGPQHLPVLRACFGRHLLVDFQGHAVGDVRLDDREPRWYGTLAGLDAAFVLECL